MSGHWLIRICILLANFFMGEIHGVEFDHCFDLDENLVLLPLHDPNGSFADGYMALDTGATFICLDEECRSLCVGPGRPMSVPLAIGSATLQLFETNQFKVGDFLVRKGLTAAIFDCKELQEAIGRKLIGLLGTPAFRGKILDFDYDADVVRIMDTLPDDLIRPNLTIWNFDKDQQHGLIYVHLNIDGRSMKVQIDTGSGGFLDIPMQDFEELEQGGRLTRTKIPRKTAMPGKILESPCGEGTGLDIDKFHFKQFRIDVSDTAILGMEFIRCFRFVIDYQQCLIYLIPSTRYIEYEPAVRTGIGLHWVKNITYIEVDKDSDAEKCGMKNGERLVSIQGQSIDALDFSHARALLRAYHMHPVSVVTMNSAGQLSEFSLHE